MPKRGSYDREIVHSIIDQSIVCHVGIAVDGLPRVIPTAILRLGEHVYLHGNVNSQLLRNLAAGAPACIAVSIIDSLVAARSGFHCAVDFRSVVIFGVGEEILDPAEKDRIMGLFIDHMLPGHKVRPSKPQELGATAVIRFPLNEVSAKIRDSGVSDFEEDRALDLWAGIVPLKIAAGPAKPCSFVPAGNPLPAYVENFRGWGPARGSEGA
jgi:nitroimidazol reductase NimA-like FMN-containing flavoprotein (pyridoxamine 5'-phosphate oxidase superfamily)